MKKNIFLIIIVILMSSCNLWKKEVEVVIEWKVVSEQGKNAEVPAGVRYKTFSIKTGEHKVFKKKDFIKEINNLNIDNLELLLNKNQKNRWWFDNRNLKDITFETVLPENDKKQEYINLIIPIIYQPFQVIFTDVVDGGIDRDDIFNNIEKIANTNDDKNCWKRLYNITETSLFNKIFDRVNDFYDEFLASNYYSEVEDYDVHLLLSKYVYQFDNEKLELLDKRLNNYKNIETKIYIPKLNFENDTLINYKNLEISFIDSSGKEIIKLFDTK